MNLNALSTQAMLAHSDAWLHMPRVRTALTAHPLGAAVLAQVQVAHVRLAERHGQHEPMTEEGEDLVALDQDYERKARALYGMLDALIQSIDDPDEAAAYQDLQARLFPDGLRAMQRTAADLASAMLALERRITPAVLARLSTVRVGKSTLVDLYRAWLAAGTAVAHAVRERARQQLAAARQGTAMPREDLRSARQHWARTVLTFLCALEILPVPEATRALVLTPLQQSIQDAMCSRPETGSAGHAAGSSKGYYAVYDDDDDAGDTLDNLPAITSLDSGDAFPVSMFLTKDPASTAPTRPIVKLVPGAR